MYPGKGAKKGKQQIDVSFAFTQTYTLKKLKKILFFPKRT